MTYRERREARAERLRDWAAKREAKSAAAFARTDELRDVIPFGQPILVGHHSERRHRRHLERMHRGMDQAVEHQAVAQRMTGRADNIEAQLEGAIYSDDPDAIEQLEARLEGLEAERARVKAYNASCRKGAPDTSLLTERERQGLAGMLKYAPIQARAGQFPAYHLSNMTGNIARNRKRLEALKRARARAAREEETS